jgi:hypothetical protein
MHVDRLHRHQRRESLGLLDDDPRHNSCDSFRAMLLRLIRRTRLPEYSKPGTPKCCGRWLIRLGAPRRPLSRSRPNATQNAVRGRDKVSQAEACDDHGYLRCRLSTSPIVISGGLGSKAAR